MLFVYFLMRCWHELTHISEDEAQSANIVIES
jgi:hypothetical protein